MDAAYKKRTVQPEQDAVWSVEETEESPENGVAERREEMGTLLTPEYFEKYEHRIRASFLEELRKVTGENIHRTPTWRKIGEIIEKLFEEMGKKECVLPERAIDIKVISLEEYNQDNTKKKMATLLGFSTFETMMKCIELGRNLEEGQV